MTIEELRAWLLEEIAASRRSWVSARSSHFSPEAIYTCEVELALLQRVLAKLQEGDA